MRINIPPFFQGILGVIVGVFLLFFFLSMGFFEIMDKIHTVSFICGIGEIRSSRGIKCQILEIKDLGDHLKKEEMLSPPPENRTITDKKTPGKFIQVKYKIKNERETTIHSPGLILLDNNRKYEPTRTASYWIPQKFQAWDIPPGLEREMIEIFEIPKEIQEPFKFQLQVFLPDEFLF